MLKLPAPIQESIRRKEISSGHARALVNLPNQRQQVKAWQQIMRKKLSVRQTEELVNNMDASKEVSSPRAVSEASHFDHIESRLRDRFATKVKIVEKNKGKGEIHIQYYSSDDLERILEIMNYE